MDYEAELLLEARKAIEEMPENKDQIIGAYEWAMGEIEDSGSDAHEYELFMNRLDEIRDGPEPLD